jgi:hypothetical protein
MPPCTYIKASHQLLLPSTSWHFHTGAADRALVVSVTGAECALSSFAPEARESTNPTVLNTAAVGLASTKMSCRFQSY